jgi:hypothetical protein
MVNLFFMLTKTHFQSPYVRWPKVNHFLVANDCNILSLTAKFFVTFGLKNVELFKNILHTTFPI